MAIAIALPGFNDLRRSVIPIFLFIDHFFYRFPTLSEKLKKIYRLQFYFYCKMHYQIPFFLALVYLCGDFKCLLKAKFCGNVGNIWTNSPLQNMTTMVRLCWLTFDIFNYKPSKTMLNYVRQFFKTRRSSFPRALTVKWSRWPSIFLHFLRWLWTKNVRKFQVAMNPTHRNFLNFAKSYVLSFLSKVLILWL